MHQKNLQETRIRKRRRKEGNVLFNDALNTFYLGLYGVGHMVKDHSDSERGNPLPPHGLPVPITARVLLYAPSHRQDSTYHGLCYTSRGALAGSIKGMHQNNLLETRIRRRRRRRRRRTESKNSSSWCSHHTRREKNKDL